MNLAPVRFLANCHILLVIGNLREIRIRRRKRKFGPNGILQVPLNGQVFSRPQDKYEVADYKRIRVELLSGMSAWVYSA